MQLFRILLFCSFIVPVTTYAGEELWRSAAGGDTEQVQHLLDEGANINSTSGDDNTTPLMEAAKNNHLKTVQLLVERGAKLETYCAFGSTALVYASRHADLPLIQHLVQSGAKINNQKGDSYTALMFAANSNKPEVVQWLIDQGANLQFTTPTGWNAMHAACQRNNPENVAVLIKAGMKPRYWTANRWSPLMIAAEAGHTDVINVLIKAGAHPSEGNGDINALVASLRNQQYDAAEALTAAGADLRGNRFMKAPLIYAASMGEVELCRLMIDRGVEVPRFGSGVYGAALNGYPECVELLCAVGAQIHEKDWEKVEDAILDRSDVRSHIAILRADYLQDAKDDAEKDAITASLQPAFAFMRAAHIGETNTIKSGMDALMEQSPWAVVFAAHYAKKEGRIETARALQPVYYKAKRLAERKPSDLKALTLAAKNNDVKSFERKLKNGADPNYGNPKEYSPMMIAIEGHHPELVKLLLDHGADPNKDPGWNSRSPLAQACYLGTPEIVNLLLVAGAAPDAGGDGFTPLYFSAGKGDTQSLKLLLDAGASINLGCPGFEKRTALIEAAHEGHSETVAFLVSRGADVNQPDEKGVTPVKAASSNAKPAVARELIALGAKLPDRMEDFRPKITLSDVRDAGKLEMLLNKKADPNAKTVQDDERMVTPLYELLSDSNPKHACIVLLLDAGADLKLVEGPLTRAYSMKDTTVDLLIKSGADVNQADYWFMGGARPIQMAAGSGKFDLMRKLLDAGADPSLRTTQTKRTLEQFILNYPHLDEVTRKRRLEQALAVITEWKQSEAANHAGATNE